MSSILLCFFAILETKASCNSNNAKYASASLFVNPVLIKTSLSIITN